MDIFNNYESVMVYGLWIIVGSIVIAVIIGVLIFAFWVSMLIDCLKRDFKKDYEKIVWVLVMIFLHFLGATIYYFVIKKEIK